MNVFPEPRDIAANALFLIRQQPSAWTFELDLLPSRENR